MFKRLFLIGALCISLMALCETEAKAWPPWVGGWGGGFGSTEFYSDWRAVAGGLLDEYPFNIEYTIVPYVMEVLCCNNGGNCYPQQESFRFRPEVILEGTDAVSVDEVLKGGKYESLFELTDAEWFDIFFCERLAVNDQSGAFSCFDDPGSPDRRYNDICISRGDGVTGEGEEEGYTVFTCDQLGGAVCHNENNWWVADPEFDFDAYVKITELKLRIIGRLEDYLGCIDSCVDPGEIAHIEAIGTANEKRLVYDWSDVYFWSLKKDGDTHRPDCDIYDFCLPDPEL